MSDGHLRDRYDQHDTGDWHSVILVVVDSGSCPPSSRTGGSPVAAVGALLTAHRNRAAGRGSSWWHTVLVLVAIGVLLGARRILQSGAFSPPAPENDAAGARRAALARNAHPANALCDLASHTKTRRSMSRTPTEIPGLVL